LLHIARALDAFDRAEAERLLERGITEAGQLPEPERGVILAQAVSLAAAVSPKRAVQLADSVPDAAIPGGVMTKALFDMLSHGHVEEAVRYLSDPTLDGEYPYAAAQQAMARSDDATRLRVLRAALAAMRGEMATRDRGRFFRGKESRIFRRWWALLPSAEAKAFVGELVQWIVAQPDQFIRASVQDLKFSSTREHQLFEVLGPLRRLDPQLTDSLLETHPQLAAAAARYPYGHESIDDAVRQRPPASPPPQQAEPYYFAIGHRLIPISEAIRTGFKEPFDVAMRAYAVDANHERPNDAPQECWPSAQEFRTILYRAGKHEGRAAIRHLDRIPERTLRLFAQIELAAALAGRPQIGGTSITPGPHGFRSAWELEKRATQRPTAPPPFPITQPWTPAKRPSLPPSNEARIAPTRHTSAAGPSGGSGPDYWVIENAPFKAVLANLYDIAETRIDMAAPLDSTAYDLALALPRSVNRETMIRLMRESIERTFHVAREVRSMEVDVLTAPHGITAPEAHDEDFAFGVGSIGFAEIDDGGTSHVLDGARLMEIMNLHTVPSEAGDDPEEAVRVMRNFLMKMSYGSVRGAAGAVNSIADHVTMGELCQVLESSLNRPLIDETLLTGRYAVNVHSEAVTTREFLSVLCDKLGVVVKTERRDVSTLVVRPK
jgi:uncharacterized protein (TIGR03435 family)